MFPIIAVVTNCSQNLLIRDQDIFIKIKNWKKNRDQSENMTNKDLVPAKYQDQLGDLDHVYQDQWSFCISGKDMYTRPIFTALAFHYSLPQSEIEIELILIF